jgi:AraC-like DNA-binding protein
VVSGAVSHLSETLLHFPPHCLAQLRRLKTPLLLGRKRAKVHTNLSVSAIAEKLGFDEPTNFSKFFRREAACSPAEFRQQHRAIN